MSTANTSSPGVPSEFGGQRFMPNYSLSDSELSILENDMVGYAEVYRPGVRALLINPYHRFADYVRTQEERVFPGASQELTAFEELETRQLALVDTRPRSAAYGRVIFAGSVSGFRSYTDEHSQTTGVVAIDELINITDNNFSAQDFNKYCLSQRIDPGRIVGVETSIKLVPGVPRFHGLRTTQLAYSAIFQLAEARPASRKEVRGYAVVARANQSTLTSTGRNKLGCAPLGGRVEWTTPESGDKEKYIPVLYDNRRNRFMKVVKRLGPTIIPVEVER